MDKPLFNRGDEAVRQAEHNLARELREIGPSRALDRFLLKYGNVRTKASYAHVIAMYLRWLKEEGVNMRIDELIQDNLICVFKSDPTDLATKRKHTDLMSEYVNRYLIERDDSESKRTASVAAIRGLYKANDSPLFGDYSVASQAVKAPPPPLDPDDIRKVLKVLPRKIKTPLLIIWRSGIEVHRVLAMRWEFPTSAVSTSARS